MPKKAMSVTTRKRKRAAGAGPKKRAYNNETRQQKVQDSQKRIVQSLVELLVERKGGEVGMDLIAERSGISERTIFRFFKDKASLEAATNDYLQYYLRESMTEIELIDIAGFAREVFARFDRFENLVLAYLYSSFGREARALLRQQLNQMLIAHIVHKKGIELNAERSRRLAVIVEMINAKIWFDIRNDFGYSGVEIGPAIEWALKTLIDNL